jgi:hypothetical protein
MAGPRRLNEQHMVTSWFKDKTWRFSPHIVRRDHLYSIFVLRMMHYLVQIRERHFAVSGGYVYEALCWRSTN